MEGFNSSWQSVEVKGNERESREEVVGISGNENFERELTSSDEQDTINRGDGASSSSRRVQYSRNTPHQIEQLEKFFKKNPHPTEREREEIGRKLNIEMSRIKFWFQNRRTQMKTQAERHENAILKEENEELKVENLAMKELAAVKKPLCHQCGGQANVSSIEEHKILIENARLKQELSSMTTLVTQLLGSSRPSSSTSLANTIFQSAGPSQSSSSRLQHGYNNNNYYVEQASRAMEELLKLGLVNAPLWNENNIMEGGGGETLNFEEYLRAFPTCLIGTKPPGFVSEATRASAVVSMSSLNLVAALLNANQWREMFVGMIGTCSTMEVICNGVGGSRNGALQLMKAEIQVISSLVPVRVLEFIRFAKEQAEGVWVVVDLSVNATMEGQHLTRRCPSGCILHDMPNGFSKVTWIEHTEYNEQLVPKPYRQLVRSGVGFGAQRWISALLRHCEGLTASMSDTLNHPLLLDRKRSLKGLAQRMTSIFCAAVCSTGDQQWDMVADAPGKPRIMARKCESGLGEPSGIIISATYSVWMPAKHRQLFDLLLTKELRCVWDVICHKIAIRKMFHFPLGQNENSPNSISILNSNNTHAKDNQIMVLQETVSDMTGSLIVYACVDFPTVSLMMNGGDPSSVALLPLGLCIVPGYGEGDAQHGSMVTVGFQILLRDLATSNISARTIGTINNLVSRTVLGIEEIVQSSRQ
ncbi:hypothetical protein SSX86_018077 [Deinandra increscens subsp. villosa]|uniref:Uncharacterized protein n=1 Tax=Deinandra increscens subsp. villosa TaxID=3103831 RepID=A0AAP0CQ29_9ASTR